MSKEKPERRKKNDARKVFREGIGREGKGEDDYHFAK
jgi:hypothetical protein